jgi:pSer/pThr/pTyr-binding forkhead associated (FHA) protein
MPKLTVVLGRTPLKVYDLDQPVIKIGRVQGMDIVIDNMSVSRTQAEIVKQDDGTWIVRDAGSSNGTFVNGDKLGGDRPLQPGDEISMGKYSVLFDRALEVQPQAAPRATAPASVAEHGTMFLKADEVKKMTQQGAQKRQAHLDWEIKSEKGTHPLGATGAALIGSDELCDLNIAGATNHLLIVKVGEGYEARNLSSFRGMTVKGAKAKRVKLADGDVIELGGLKLTFKDDLR